MSDQGAQPYFPLYPLGWYKFFFPNILPLILRLHPISDLAESKCNALD